MQIETKEYFKEILKKLAKILHFEAHVEQATFLIKLYDLLDENSIDEFEREINTGFMWGGAGAVWEVYIMNQEIQKEFFNQLNKLILFMKQENIMSKMAKSRLKTIEKILKKM